ncbi:MAG: hypothetical protein ABFD97_08755 [Syntrophobacter sp.]
MKRNSLFRPCSLLLSLKQSGNLLLLPLAFVLFLSHAVPSAGSDGYTKYCNPRFGFCVEYPASLTKDPPPANNDGISLRDRDAFTMSASGINNVLDDTVESLMSAGIENMDRVTYKSKGRDWFVLSGFDGTKVRYEKTWVGKGSINTLFIEYQADQKSKYDEIAARVSRSFKPGRLNTGN